MIVFEDVARKLSEFVTLFQIDQPMASFLVQTLDGLARFLMERFIQKSVMDKAHSSISLPKIDLNDVAKQKSCLADLGFAVNYEIKVPRIKKKGD